MSVPWSFRARSSPRRRRHAICLRAAPLLALCVWYGQAYPAGRAAPLPGGAARVMEPVDLPLFPLSTLLVPSMSLPLHIFEPRYRQMIAACLRADQRFGVVLIREGQEVG